MKAWLAVALALGAVLAALPAVAQSPVKTARIGMLRPFDDPLASGSVAQNVAAFKQGLADEGYVEGRNVVIDHRSTRMTAERLDESARELVRLNVDVIYAVGPQALRAARTVTTTVPIVAHDYETDPVAAGFIASYARPGGNVTGLFLDLPELTGKWLQLLGSVVPGLKRVAVMWDPTTGDAQVRAIQVAMKAVGLVSQVLEVRGRSELEARFQTAAEGRAEAVIVLGSPLFTGGAAKPIADAALRTRLPAVSLFQTIANAGGLLAYGPNVPDLYRRQGHLVAKILRGAKPGDLPIERPTRFELTVNARTAKRLGLTIPPDVLGRADRVIE
jgi:putative ABC transport system substrate-binding protein